MKKNLNLLATLLFSGIAFSQVGINTDVPNTNSWLHVSEQLGSNPKTYKGILTPRYTTAERDAHFSLTAAENGLLIYNITDGCYNFWRQASPAYPSNNGVWVNMCGASNSPTTNGVGVVASYDCSPAISGTNTVGVPVSGLTKTVIANVTSVGSYNISASANGITFSGSGIFNATGNQNVVLTATGTPVAAGTHNFVLNTTPNCNFNVVTNAPVGTITSLNCAGATNNGTLYSNVAASGVSSVIPYTGGNAGTHNGQTVTSTGVTGLTATLSAGSFVSGSGTLTYNITGTPSGSGTASFAISIGGQSCTLTRNVVAAVANNCNPNNPTLIVDVTSSTGKVWMDRNLGANRKATAVNDAESYGSLYQWGRGSDGHQCVNRYSGDGVTNSGTTSTQATSPTPGHGNFIANTDNPNWLNSTNNTLWQGVSGTNNPCPSGYRLPTDTEFGAEATAYGSGVTNGYNSVLKMSAGGYRQWNNGNNFGNVGSGSNYWTSSYSGTAGRANQNFETGTGTSFVRSYGMSVRCIKN